MLLVDQQGGRRYLSNRTRKHGRGACRPAVGWNWIGFALSATIVGISIYVLSHILKDIDVAPRGSRMCGAMPVTGHRVGGVSSSPAPMRR